MEEALTIGQVAQMAGVGVSTVRYYEQKGLLEVPPRNDSGYRLYSFPVVDKVKFIKNARDLGFSLRDISDLIRLSSLGNSDCNCNDIIERLQQQRDEILRQIEMLNRQKARLDSVLKLCRGDGDSDPCDFVGLMLELEN